MEPGKDQQQTAAAVVEGDKKLYLDEATGEMVSKNELKTRIKLREKEKKKKEKEETKKPVAAAKSKAAAEELDPTQYTHNRKQYIQ